MYTELIATNSGTFTNSPTRVTGRSLLPVAFSSTLVVVPVNTAPHASTPRSSQVRTRERARAELAEKLAEQREREKANETDLVEFFRNDELLTEADAARAAAVTAAQRDYDTTLASVQQRQAECLRTLADRGEKVDDLTALTGLSSTEVRKLLKQAPPTPQTKATETAPAATTTVA